MRPTAPFAEDTSRATAEPTGKVRHGFALGLVTGALGVGGCMVLGTLAMFLFPLVAGQDPLARQALDGLSNAKQAVIGMHIYAADFDDRLPLRNTWMDALAPYVCTRNVDVLTRADPRDEAVFRSPALRQTQPDAFGYAFNEDLVAKNLAELKNPESTPMVFDSTVTTRNATAPTSTMPSPGRYRRGGTTKNAVAYADTSAKLVEAK